MKTFLLEDGRRLAYREAGSGPPLVLLHGWAMSSAVFSELLEALSPRFRVLAPDLRGHGFSDPGEGVTLAGLAADLRQWWDGLDLRGASLLGWSLGGQVALTLSPALSTRVERLVLLSSTPRFTAGADWPFGLPAGQVRAMARSLRGDYGRAMGDFFALQFAGEEIPRERHRRIVEFAVRAGRLPDPPVALAALETLATEDLRGVLCGIEIPTLVLHGGFDRIIPPGAGRYFAETLPDARHVEMDGVGHAPFLSRPDETMGHLERFLS